MYRKFLKQSLILFILFMIIVSGTNFVIDPSEIYLKKIISNIKSKEFAEKLFLSADGIIQTGWNERLIKTELAKSAGEFDCIILGSSHIMEISSIRNTGNIKKQCKKVLNLGVSGGSLEDIAIFSYILLSNSKIPHLVLIDIDPWTLKFGMDSRFGAYQSYYEKMNILLNEIDFRDRNTISYREKLMLHLFNGEYFYKSLLTLINSDKNITSISLFKKDIRYPQVGFSYQEGATEAVTLKDGSHLYAKSWMQMKKNTPIPMGGGGYKIYGIEYDLVALEYLKKLIKLMQTHGISVKLLMTPYHPNVFKQGKTKVVRHLTQVENVVKKFSQKNNLKYYGSFFPGNLGCKNSEFFDFMHPTNECLNRIDFSK